MKKLNLGAIVALFALSLALGACATDRYAFHDGHGNRGDDVVF
ncbi:MAG TPA: hypothetical protein VFZ07_00510 [Dongiaceae bacterium]|jgi:hypothetical protein